MQQFRPQMWKTFAGTMLLALVLAGCTPTQPKIGEIRLGKDKEVKTETTTFGPKDTVYGIATISTPGKATIKWQVIVEKAAGVTDNFHIPNADASVELPSSGTSSYDFPPGDGFPVGKYRLEVRMLDESGAEKDMKTMTFDVANS